MIFSRRKPPLKYDNLYDWFVGENVPERFAFLDDSLERDRWINQYAELRRHLFDEHIKTLPLDEQRQIREGSHPSQCHSKVADAKPYGDRLVLHLADLGYTARCGVGLYHMDRMVLFAELDHEPNMQEYGKLLPFYFDGFEVKYSGQGRPKATSRKVRLLIRPVAEGHAINTPESQPVASNPKRRWFQFSLAELLALTTSVAVSLSLLKWSSGFWPLVLFWGFILLTIYIDHRSS